MISFGVTAFGLVSVAASLGYAGMPGTLTVKECQDVGRDNDQRSCLGPVHATDGTLLDEESSVDDEYRVGDRVAVRRVAAMSVIEGRKHIGMPGLVAGMGLLVAGFWMPYLTTGTFPWRTTPPPRTELRTPGPRARLTRNVLCALGACMVAACTIASLL
ncbi:hypothetical protein [Streptomyces halobius]|uniref:Uncharacterized protein n=1 Tax=Streptomyces halobius TaxID=2879846 RepID=A0ABY4ML94_9ACTN|nr:hypothetical protein [Streptomyces halobius]UQA97096.1 hypothetical protein K9S39_39185 [Streptomyces halobius]